MNRMIKTIAVATVAGLALCGSAVAAPKGGAMGGMAPAQQVSRREAPRQQGVQMPQRGHNGAQVRPGARNEPRREVAQPRPRPAPRPEPHVAQHRLAPRLEVPSRHHKPAHRHHHNPTLHS